ncbi:CapA family protein [Geotalea sp. SG265]|uniref:CapA family protein n=1 Tax=Geotalea sp. SG265 TaxID=2922867 RepID=UPI001FAF7C13|nr:CapA family protein [Geotalea sp. SG265]
MAEIVIGGDICPINRNLPYFEAGDAAALFNDLLVEFQRADLSIVNLECPLIDKETPIRKSGPVLGAGRSVVQALRNAHIHIANLANNHILDHGFEGYQSTVSACKDASIAIVGGGENLQQAREMLIREVGGVRLGILAYAEREFSIARAHLPGANPLDLAAFRRAIRHYKGQYDYLIVLLHGGIEHYSYPSPRLRDTCRFMIEEGAGAVICQHSHCPGCYENYENGHIVYGQGNLLFDRFPYRGEPFYQGFLVRLKVMAEPTSTILFIPYRQSDVQPGARKMEPGAALQFMKEFNERSGKIASQDFVEAQWEELCRKKKNEYFSALRGHSRPLRYLNRKMSFTDNIYTPQGLLCLQNMIRCESHRETLETLLNGMLKG